MTVCQDEAREAIKQGLDPHSGLTINDNDKPKPVLTITPDRRLEIGEDVTPLDVAKVLTETFNQYSKDRLTQALQLVNELEGLTEDLIAMLDTKEVAGVIARKAYDKIRQFKEGR